MSDRFPFLVSQALQLAASRNFNQSCTEEVGRLLHLLTSHQGTGTVGELGTGCGVGTAWMATALQPDVSLITVESDEDTAMHASEIFQSVPVVRVLHGDWRVILSHGPFVLLFIDAPEPKRDHPDELIAALQPGGMIVLDDLTPVDAWPEEWRGAADAVRDFWLHDPRLIALELRLTPTMAVILAVKVV